MPWCPKCKMEYREGIRICADCGTPLVEDFKEEEEQVSILLTEKNELAQQFYDFLKYSGVSGALLGFLEETGQYNVSVPASCQKEAKRLYTGFYLAEKEKEPKEAAEPSKAAASVYVRKEDKYKDFSSTAWTFLLVGIAGLVFTLLNILGYFSIFANPISYTGASLIFLGCLFVSGSSFRSAKRVKGEIAEETDFTAKLKVWLEDNIREEELLSVEDSTLSEEVNFLNKLDYIKNSVTAQFGEIDEAFLEEITEEFYNSHFEG